MTNEDLIKMKLESPRETFVTDKVVGDVIAYIPDETLEVKWKSGEATVGNVLTPTIMKDQPEITWEGDSNSFYTLLMVDPDAPSRENPSAAEFQHWLVVNIPGNRLSEGEIRSEYIGAGPPKETDLHRYVFLVMKQRAKGIFANIPFIKNSSTKNRPNFNTKAFIQKYTLRVVAGNFVQAKYDDYVEEMYKGFDKN